MATPTLVQYAAFSMARASSSTQRKAPLPNVVLSGNCVIVCIYSTSSATPSAPTITDDQSNTYTIYHTETDAGNSEQLIIAYKNNVTNGPRTIIVNHATGLNYMGLGVMEFYNVDTSGTPTDGHNGAKVTASTNPKPTSFNTAVNGDLIVSCFLRTDNAPVASWTAPSGTLVGADREDGLAFQYQIQAVAGAIQPQITTGTSATYLAAAAAFKSGTAGTAPLSSAITPRVVGVIHQVVDFNGGATSVTEQFPASHGGDMFYAAFIGVAGNDPGTITDTAGNTWTPTGASVNGGNGYSRSYYVRAPTLSAANVVTIPLTAVGATPGSTILFFEVIGMDIVGTPLTAHATSTGNAGSTGIASASVTPTTAGLIFNSLGVTSNTVLSCSGGSSFMASTDPNEEVSPWANDENNGWAVYRNATTSSLQETWTSNIAAGQWTSIADAFSSMQSPADVIVNSGSLRW